MSRAPWLGSGDQIWSTVFYVQELLWGFSANLKCLTSRQTVSTACDLLFLPYLETTYRTSGNANHLSQWLEGQGEGHHRVFLGTAAGSMAAYLGQLSSGGLRPRRMWPGWCKIKCSGATPANCSSANLEPLFLGYFFKFLLLLLLFGKEMKIKQKWALEKRHQLRNMNLPNSDCWMSVLTPLICTLCYPHKVPVFSLTSLSCVSGQLWF